MLATIFESIFDTSSSTTSTTSSTSTNLDIAGFLICIVVALVVGVFLAVIHTYKTHYTMSFLVTLALLPAIVSVVIMMVNGNVGAGVAVAGAFSLVRFRSAPGTAKEICAIFLAMATGLIIGMGYIGFAVVFVLILGAAVVLLEYVAGRSTDDESRKKTLTVTIPEDLNYGDIFDDLFAEFTDKWEVVSVKTTNMGSLFRLKYNIVVKDPAREKEFIDAIRCRNGNLEISITRQEMTAQYEL